MSPVLHVDQVMAKAIAFLEKDDPDQLAAMTAVELSDYINKWLIKYRREQGDATQDRNLA